MAAQNSKLVQDFLTKLATDPELLLRFINDPDGVMNANKIRTKATREHIKLLLALEVAKKVLVSPLAAYIHWGR